MDFPMAPGRKTGGRKKGTPNHVTTGARKRILALWDSIGPDMEDWLRRCAEGEPVPMVKDGTPVIDQAGNPVMVRRGEDPGKAFLAALQMLEYVLPKLGRTEVVGEGGGAITVRVVKYGEDN